jgi:hypothetical protein
MTGRSGKIYVTKLAAAQRQLCAAIRMFFGGEDELAVHTVASAAYRVLSDLKAKHGRNEAADNYLNSVFYAVRDYRRGTLPAYLADDPSMMEWIRDMADRLPLISDVSRFEDIRAEVSDSDAQEFWRDRNAIANFLKHADREKKFHISMDDVDNLELLMQASGAYIDLTHDNLGPEGFVLWVYFNTVKGMQSGMPPQFRNYVLTLEHVDPGQRQKFCSEWLRKMKSAIASK